MSKYSTLTFHGILVYRMGMAINITTASPVTSNKATQSGPALISNNSFIARYPNEMLETPIDETRLDYLTPLIVILLATLVSIIILFSCVLCSCFMKEEKDRKILGHNSKIVESSTMSSVSYGGDSPTTPPTSLRRTRRELNYSTLPVILAYQRAELHAEWCPCHQPVQEHSLEDSLLWEEHNHETIKVNTKRILPWKSSGSKFIHGTELRTSISAPAVDRVTVV